MGRGFRHDDLVESCRPNFQTAHSIIASASEAIQTVPAATVWIASSLSLLAMTAERHELSFSRCIGTRALRCSSPSKVRGCREGRVAAAPGAPAQTKIARARKPQVQAVITPAFPARWFYGLYGLSSVNQRLPPSPAQCASIVANLAPAWARQDHTTSPSATYAARQSARSRPPHSAPRS